MINKDSHFGVLSFHENVNLVYNYLDFLGFYVFYIYKYLPHERSKDISSNVQLSNKSPPYGRHL